MTDERADAVPLPRLPRAGDAFLTTRWTRILASHGDSAAAREALSELCAAYYGPVLAFIRARSRDDEAARDLTQEFFARLLSGSGLRGADPRRGRFRFFLLGAVRHFLADMHDREGRAKRGGGHPHLSLDAGTDSAPGLELPDPGGTNPDLEFDRKWAVTLLERALGRIEAEQATDGSRAHFETLKPWLTGDRQTQSPGAAAQALGMSEGAFKVALHRLRKRFRELVREEIAGTVDRPDQVGEELRYLIAVLSVNPPAL